MTCLGPEGDEKARFDAIRRKPSKGREMQSMQCIASLFLTHVRVYNVCARVLFVLFYFRSCSRLILSVFMVPPQPVRELFFAFLLL